MSEWVITAIIQAVASVFMLGMFYQSHTRVVADLDKKANKDTVDDLKEDHEVLALEFRGLDRRVTKLEPRGGRGQIS